MRQFLSSAGAQPGNPVVHVTQTAVDSKCGRHLEDDFRIGLSSRHHEMGGKQWGMERHEPDFR